MFDQIYTCEKLAVTRVAAWQCDAPQQRLSAQARRSHGDEPRRTTGPSNWYAGFIQFRRLLTRSKDAT
jgi:hypothetical protein